jgi:hypothetical protein
MGVRMTRPNLANTAALAALGAVCVLWACGKAQKPIDRVGVDVVEKTVFQGSWYMAMTVIDVDYQGSALGTFPGDAASDAAQSFTAMPRIRWVIDENYLFAYRDYDLTLGGDGQSKGPVPSAAPSTAPSVSSVSAASTAASSANGAPSFSSASASEGNVLGQPVAVFKIEKHFDIRRDYNPSTGEELNVIVENDTDRRWYERQYMRVDWSKNLLPGYYGQTYDLNELLGSWKREPADIYVQRASSFPDSWQPRFDRMLCDGSKDKSATCTAQERDFADDYDKGELYHMSFVTQELLSPGTVQDPQTGADVNYCTAVRYSDAPACTSVASYVRTSFLRVSDKREYEPVNWVDSRFDRFGFFRLEQPTRDRSTGAPDDPAYFSTDFLNYNVNRHNIWKKWFDKDGNALAYKDRPVRQVVWYTTPELPAHLVRPAFDVVGEWNEVLMQTVRRLRGQPLPSYPDVTCQTGDPDGYCYCQTDPESGQIIRPSCPGQYDPFTPPDQYGAGANSYDCWVSAKDGTEPAMDDPKLGDKDFYRWFDAHFTGSECVSVLRVNDCNLRSIAANSGTTQGLSCQERGDLRFKFLSYVDQPGTSFLGIATLRGDPVTGEVLTGDANVGGPALDEFRTSALLTYDLVHGTIDERDVVTGDDVRGYFGNLDHVDLPARPRTDFSVGIESGRATSSPMSSSARTEIDNRMHLAMQRINRLQGPQGLANTFGNRSKALVGTDLEQRLSSGPEALVAAGIDQLQSGAPPEITDTMLDRISPFRSDITQKLTQATQLENKLARANVEMPNEYVDNSVQSFVSKHLDWPRAHLELGLNRLLYRQTILHELGHCFGLRHDFGASADSQQYAPDYYEIVKRIPLPDPANYDKDGTPGFSADEQVVFDQAYDKARADRELAGIDGTMSSSVMEYTSNWYERIQPLGLYDKAAIANGYGDLVEAYAGPAQADTPRESFKTYVGGNDCQTDADCPYAASGARAGFLLDSNMQAGLTQRCVQNPSSSSSQLCSSFDDDLSAQAANGGSHQPLVYRFCSDERADTTLAWCNRFDEGASYREMVRNVEEDYERMYPFAAFRRYRKTFDISTYQQALLGRRLNVLQNVYQNLLFEYSSDPSFRQQTGPFGFYDQFLATTDILNFYARILAQPNVGGYVYDAQTAAYERGFVDDTAPQADMPVPFGLGRYFNSDYQTGLSGIERIERVGSFFDKVWVIQLLSTRGGQANYTRDVAFYANFYDLFPAEMQQIFNGMIRGFPQAYMPRVQCEAGATFPSCKQPQLVYMDFYRGDCSQAATCKPNPADTTYAGMPVLDGGGSLSLQIYAASYGLQDFPVYFDTSFQNQLFMCIEGQADCFKPDPAAVEGVDYVRYTSDRYSKSFLSFQLEPGVGAGQQTSTGFAMIKEARDLNSILSVLLKLRDVKPAYAISQLSAADRSLLQTLAYDPPAAPPQVEAEITRIGDRITNLESFFNEMIQLQRDYQIQSFSYFGAGQ